MSKDPRTLSQDQIQVFADKCKTRNEFAQRFAGPYTQARRRGFIDEVCAHMVSPRKPSGYWTVDRLRETALKYDSRMEFYEKEGAAYQRCCQLGLLQEMCSHMTHKRMHRKKRDAEADSLLDTIDNTLQTSRRNRATAYTLVNAPRMDDFGLPRYGADWVAQLYDQLAYDNEGRALNYIEILRDRGDHDAVDAAWQLFTKHMDGNWCTAAG